MSQSNVQHAQNLEEAFDAFNRMSVQLESSYRDLEDQVNVLNKELSAARSERLKQLYEKERLADQLGQLLTLLPGAVLVLNGEGEVTQSNPMAEQLFGEKLDGKSWKQISQCYFDHAGIETGDVRLKNGHYVTISRRTLDRDPGQVVLIMDISDQHDLKEMLNRQDRLATMGEMVARLAHQIRTPLATALLYTSTLQERQLETNVVNRMSAKIRSRLEYLEQMVNDMLQYTRGGEALASELINLENLIEEFRQVIDPQLQQHNGKLAITISSQVPDFSGDSRALLGALFNLASNAMQSVESSVSIQILFRHTPTHLLITFSDNGPGIDEENIEKIFSPFFTSRVDGTGLGLAVVQATIHAHQGEIELISEKGQGASFEIRLPLINTDSMMASGLSNAITNELETTGEIRHLNEG